MQLFLLICITFTVAAVYSIRIPSFGLFNRARALVAAPPMVNIQRIGQDLAMFSDRVKALENIKTRNALSFDDERGDNKVRGTGGFEDFFDEILADSGITIEDAEAFLPEFVGITSNADLLDVFIFFKLFSIHRKLSRIQYEVDNVTDITNQTYMALTDTIIPHLTAIKLKHAENLDIVYDMKAALSINTLNTNKLVSLQHEQRLFNKYISESVRYAGHTCLRQNPFKSPTKYN